MDHKALKDKKSPTIARKANWVNSLAFHESYPLKAFSRLVLPSFHQVASEAMQYPVSSANPVLLLVSQHLQASPNESFVQVFSSEVHVVYWQAVTTGSMHA